MEVLRWGPVDSGSFPFWGWKDINSLRIDIRRPLLGERKQYLPWQIPRCLCTVVGPVPRLGKATLTASSQPVREPPLCCSWPKCRVSRWGKYLLAVGLARFKGMQTYKLQIFPAPKVYFVLEIMLLWTILVSFPLCLLMLLGGAKGHCVGFFLQLYIIMFCRCLERAGCHCARCCANMLRWFLLWGISSLRRGSGRKDLWIVLRDGEQKVSCQKWPCNPAYGAQVKTEPSNDNFQFGALIYL